MLITGPASNSTSARSRWWPNTGTYLDAPLHRYADGKDLARLPLESLADPEAVVVRVPAGAGRAITRMAFESVEIEGTAVLVETG